MKQRAILLAALLTIRLVHAEAPAPMAKVNGVAIPQIRFDTILKLALAQGGSDTPVLRQQIRSQLIAQELLRQEASKKKLQNDPQVIAAREEAGQRAMIERYVALNVKPEPVTEPAVHARYDDIVRSLGEKEYQFSVIALAKEDEARQVLQQIQQNKAGFAEAAKKHSLLPNRSNGGLADWVSFPLPVTEGQTAGLPLAVARIVAALPKGSLAADPVAVGEQVWLIKSEDVRPTTIPVYAAVASTLRRTLEAQALEKASAVLMKRLITAARIE